MYSNFYVFRYAGIMVIIVAAILSAAAMLLKPAQDKNIAVAKMQGILSAVQVDATGDEAIEKFNEYVEQELVISPEGELLSIYDGEQFEKGDTRAFGIDMKQQLYNKTMGNPYQLPLFVAEKEGQKYYIIPLQGKGLWGPIWGYIALASDLNTVVGASFAHKSETPGLGAEIDQPSFSNMFEGKKIFNDQGNFVSVDVVKGGVQTLAPEKHIHAVDAISGGTITSNGVAEMLEEVLESYVEYFKKQR